MMPGPQVGYTDLIDEALQNQEPFKATFPLRPSSAGACSRKLAFELAEYLGLVELERRPMEPTVKRLLGLGSYVEWHSLKHFSLISDRHPNLRVKYKQQTLSLFRLDPANKDDTPPLIEGSMDLAVMDVENDRGGIGDVKSAKDKFSKAYQTYWDENTNKLSNMKSLHKVSDTCFYAEDLASFLSELNDPFFEDNFRQLNTYCNSDFAKLHNIDHGFIYRYSKNDSRHLEIRFAPCEKVYQDFVDKCNKVYQTVKNGTFDDIVNMGCDYPLGHIKNAFCDCMWYSGANTDAAKKEYFRTFPPKKWPTDTDRLSDQKKIESLLKKFIKHEKASEEQTQVESELVKLLGENNCRKVKLDKDNIFEVKYLKTGGPGGGPRAVLRRSKL